MKIKILLLTVLALFCISISAAQSQHTTLAKAIASAVGDEPFVVRVHYGEMLINRVKSKDFPNTLGEACSSLGISLSRKRPTDSDMRAAAAACADMNFNGGALHAEKLDKKSTPPKSSDGVQLYNWYFY